MPYYTLLTRVPDGKWAPQFGDYDQQTVKDERDDTREDWPKGTSFQIVKTKTARQSEIDALINSMNDVTTHAEANKK